MSMDLHLLALKWRWFTDIHSAMEFVILELLIVLSCFNVSVQ